MPNHHVLWEINLDADTPAEAAQKAYDTQRRPGSLATVFTVTDEQGDETTFDLPVAEASGTALGMLQAAVELWGDAVRNDEPIDGGDAVQWLTQFITDAMPLLGAVEPEPDEGIARCVLGPAADVLRGPA